MYNYIYVHTSASKDTFITSFESFLTNKYETMQQKIYFTYIHMHAHTVQSVIKMQHSTSINEPRHIGIILLTNIYLRIISMHTTL